MNIILKLLNQSHLRKEITKTNLKKTEEMIKKTKKEKEELREKFPEIVQAVEKE